MAALLFQMLMQRLALVFRLLGNPEQKVSQSTITFVLRQKWFLNGHAL